MYLCVDVGGTKTLLSAFSDEGEPSREVRFETPTTYQEFLNQFQANLKELDQNDYIASAIAIPGQIDRNEGIGLSFGNLTWKNVPVQADVERIINAPVIVENDAKAGAIFEAVKLKGEFNRVLYVAIGTGIGVGLVTNGVIDTDVGDLGGSSIPVAYMGKYEYWERIASGKAIVKQFGKKADEIEDPEIWKTFSHNLATGLSDLISILEPDVVVIGGGVGAHFEKFENFLKQALKQYETPMLVMPPLVKAIKPEEAVIYGCYELVRQKYGNNTN